MCIAVYTMYVHTGCMYIHINYLHIPERSWYILRYAMYMEYVMYIQFSDISMLIWLRWTVEELKKVIAMLHNPAFDSNEIDPDLHKRMDKAVLDGRIKCFNMREGDADGDQDLHLWARELEDVCREIMEDPVFKGNQNFKFEMDLDEAGKRLFGGEANAGVAFQIGQLRYVQCLFVYVHDNIQYIHVYTMYIHISDWYVHAKYMHIL